MEDRFISIKKNGIIEDRFCSNFLLKWQGGLRGRGYIWKSR